MIANYPVRLQSGNRQVLKRSVSISFEGKRLGILISQSQPDSAVSNNYGGGEKIANEMFRSRNVGL